MKRVLLLFTLLSLPIILFCQQDEFRNWRVGTFATVNINTQSLFNSPQKINSLSIGIEAAHRFTNRLELELGIGITKIRRSGGCCEFCDCAIPIGSFNGRDLKYLDFSIMGNYYLTQKDRLNIFATTGVEYNYLISPFDLDPIIFPPRHNQSLLGFAIGAGIEFRVFKQFHIRYTSKYISGFSNIVKGNSNSKRKYFNVNLGCGLRF